MEFLSEPISPGEEQVDIARNIKTIDWLKTEVVGSVATLFRSMVRNNTDASVEALANLVVESYLLAKRLGVSFDTLDEKVERKAKLNVERNHEIEKWYGDFSAFLDHFRGRRR